MEARTSPKKKDQIKTGRFSRSQLRILESENIAAKIPIISAARNCQDTPDMASLALKESKRFTKMASNERIDLISSSYIPRISAMVPPETPGTTSAAPIQKPLMETNK